ncbi:hypothetical protein [Planosporangium mesophilum]|uniref:Uncharacterized protein n=1 Tax=Planosporangium mesophilum TaxID=689768 RepID=A0A8J3TEP5_9ACTN|nr:hypothetical protein [Planosporangium mesophilum]NJC82532.1 hypothetical protein [Planosporangium mesophilum]GII25463.1 hypothetical protein Pme01_50600 [Planosporangium mesophilum]
MLAAVVYGAGVITDEDLGKIRSTRTYRAAIWSARFNVILVALFFSLAYAGKIDPKQWFPSLWLLGLVLIITGLVLLRRSGVPFTGIGPFKGVRDPRMMWQIYKDLVWFRRP